MVSVTKLGSSQSLRSEIVPMSSNEALGLRMRPPRFFKRNPVLSTDGPGPGFQIKPCATTLSRGLSYDAWASPIKPWAFIMPQAITKDRSGSHIKLGSQIKSRALKSSPSLSKQAPSCQIKPLGFQIRAGGLKSPPRFLNQAPSWQVKFWAIDSRPRW